MSLNHPRVRRPMHPGLDLEPLESRTHLTAAPSVFATVATPIAAASALPTLLGETLIADVDGDGRNDIVLIADPAPYNTGPTNRVWLIRALSDGTFAEPKSTPMLGVAETIAAGHFSSSRPGASDIALTARVGDAGAPQRVIRVLRYKPETGALRVVARFAIDEPNTALLMAVGNVTGNSADEIILETRSGNAGAAGTPFHLFVGIYGLAPGEPGADDRLVLKTVIKEGTYPHSLINAAFDLRLADLDGDGYQEVLFNPGPMTRAWFRAKAGAPDRRATLASLPTGVVPLKTIYADLDNDGVADRVLLDHANTGGGVASFQHGNGAGGFGALTQIGTVNVPTVGSPYGVWTLNEPTSIRDLDGDGLNDIFCNWSVVDSKLGGSGTTGYVTLTTATTGSLLAGTLTSNSAYSPLAIDDLNGDGRPDLLVLSAAGLGILANVL